MKKISRQLFDTVGNLRLLRSSQDLTTSQLAEKSGVSYALLSGIENGKRPLSDNVLQKLVVALSLSSMDRRALSSGRRLAVTGNYIAADTLIEMESEPHIDSAWLIDPNPHEMTDDRWLGKVCNGLLRRKYVYFLPDRDAAACLRARLIHKTNDEDLIRNQIEFVIVPSAIAPFFFHPITAVWHSAGEGYSGIWAFQGDGGKIDGGVPIHETSIRSISLRLFRILSDLRNQSRSPLSIDVNQSFELAQ